MFRWQFRLSCTLVTYDHQLLLTYDHQLLLSSSFYREVKQRRSEHSGSWYSSATYQTWPSDVLPCHTGTTGHLLSIFLLLTSRWVRSWAVGVRRNEWKSVSDKKCVRCPLSCVNFGTDKPRCCTFVLTATDCLSQDTAGSRRRALNMRLYLAVFLVWVFRTVPRVYDSMVQDHTITLQPGIEDTKFSVTTQYQDRAFVNAVMNIRFE
jgi:hypothetical protein